MNNVELFITGEPKGQPRPRAFARKMGSKYVARMYDSDIADDWKKAVTIGVLSAIPQAYASDDHPFDVVLRFSLPRPQYMRSTSGAIKERYRDTIPITKPDVDNLAKLVLDCITKSGRLWRDDSQVASLYVEKRYVGTSHPGITEENTGVRISIAASPQCIGSTLESQR